LFSNKTFGDVLDCRTITDEGLNWFKKIALEVIPQGLK
jgi:hypothetical protein